MEDEADNNLSEDEYKVRRHINTQAKKKPEKACRTRFDVLATPHKRAILGTYQEHAHHFPKERVDRIKRRLQELFAMTPEETEKYFEQMKSEANEIARLKMMKIMLKRTYQRQQRDDQERKAYKLIERLLKRGMMHAYKNPVPPLISVRLRNLSDIVLEQICDLRNIDIPDRDKPDKPGMFLIAVADWIAIAIEHIYYGVQLKKNEELEEIEKQAAALEKEIEAKREKTEDKEEEGPSKDKKEKPETVQLTDDEYGILEPDME